MWTIRDLYRNKRVEPGFGVLTGETEALLYIQSGRWSAVRGDRVVVFSDGCRPMILRDDIRQAIADDGDVGRVMEEVAAQLGLTDEVSAAILRMT